MNEVIKENAYRYMLVVIDGYSRKAWSVPLKTKTAKEVWAAFDKIGKKFGFPKTIWVDKGSEFYNAIWTNHLKKLGIRRKSTYGEQKSVLVERLNRTLKEEMYRRFTSTNTHEWVDDHDNLLNWYNTKVHSSLSGKTPDFVWERGVVPLHHLVREKVPDFSLIRKKLPFAIGDIVRVSRVKGHFAKGFHANFSEELFKIIQVRISTDSDQPPRYEVEDYHGDRIAGGFYAQELVKAKYPKVFLVESILKTRIKNGVRENLTKWLGWPSSFNTWEPEGNVISQ